MSGFGPIFRRELLSLWVTPLAWVLLVVFLLLQGGIFYNIVLHFTTMPELSLDVGPLQAYFGQQSILMMFSLLLLCPALTMRLFAEERRSGSIEALMTAPITPLAVVMGKYFATLCTYVLIWSPTFLYAVMLRDTGGVDWGVVAASYFGLLCIGASYLALGTLMSALSKSQLIALLLTIFAQFGLFLLGIGEYIFDPGPLWELAAHVSMTSQLDEFSKGIVDTRRLVFDFSVVLVSLFLTLRVAEAWKAEG